jgi:hypothetical protein
VLLTAAALLKAWCSGSNWQCCPVVTAAMAMAMARHVVRSLSCTKPGLQLCWCSSS